MLPTHLLDNHTLSHKLWADQLICNRSSDRFPFWKSEHEISLFLYSFGSCQPHFRQPDDLTQQIIDFLPLSQNSLAIFLNFVCTIQLIQSSQRSYRQPLFTINSTFSGYQSFKTDPQRSSKSVSHFIKLSLQPFNLFKNGPLSQLTLQLPNSASEMTSAMWFEGFG
jgi:hypothetical protein